MTAETVAYDLFLPEIRRSGVIFASPHSGRDYPQAFLQATVLDRHAIRSSEDAFVDRLYSAAPRLGAPLLCARVPRAYVDLNRGADEFDPALIANARPGGHNPRVSSGLGVIPRVVSNARPIYRGKIPAAEAAARITDYWEPYHARLRALLDESRARFGEAILIDCHSMPHEAIAHHGGGRGSPPDVVLGDRFGASAGAAVVERIEAAFAAAGLRVARNAPFAGAYIAQTYGWPSRRQHVVQVEIDRALYMDEATIRPSADFAAVQALIEGVMAEIVAAHATDLPLAAE
ncbi:N-formylglutamate amidohydrolase [Acidimangrovimonas pyrenivorans]|uniref:N-formylglutamate amidohydrolase n=1 Tax=Acidimangrovimonas pyrenivorans TaxID=2030798 RepID=A0ABV7ACG9_9RHOB